MKRQIIAEKKQWRPQSPSRRKRATDALRFSVSVLQVEKQIPFANVIHRLSWTGDRLGLGCLFGAKHLKAIAIRGKKPVTLQDPGQFPESLPHLEGTDSSGTEDAETERGRGTVSSWPRGKKGLTRRQSMASHRIGEAMGRLSMG